MATELAILSASARHFERPPTVILRNEESPLINKSVSGMTRFFDSAFGSAQNDGWVALRMAEGARAN